GEDPNETASRPGGRVHVGVHAHAGVSASTAPYGPLAAGRAEARAPPVHRRDSRFYVELAGPGWHPALAYPPSGTYRFGAVPELPRAVVATPDGRGPAHLRRPLPPAPSTLPPHPPLPPSPHHT